MLSIQQFDRFGKWLPWVLLVVSLLTHFAFFGHPNETVFDEVHFGKFISAYYTGQYYFDIHPPLGKLLIAGFGWLFGFRPEFSFAQIGEPFPDRLYLALRFLPVLAGALLPLALYALARSMGFSRRGAFLLGLFASIENALIVQSHFILLDSFLLLFGFSALLCYWRYRNGASWRWLLGMGILGALAVSIKWTGATFLALAGILELLRMYRRTSTLRPSRFALTFVVVPLLLYASIFVVHFSLLPNSGPGDAFMSARFQHGLRNSPYANDPTLQPLGMLDKIIELNREMYRANARLTATHPYSSTWYTWPFMIRPIFYWIDGAERVYLLGNPVLWWAGTAAVAIALIGLATRTNRDPLLPIFLGAWTMNLLPFIGIHRVMFLYHYLTAALWAMFILVRLLDAQPRWRIGVPALAAAALVAFFFFAPLTYGLALSPGAYESRVWFSSWR